MKVVTVPRIVAIALAALVAVAVWQRWHVLGASPFPIGIDGYFYPIQVRSILEHGVLRYPASPVAFYWMTPFAAITDPIVGAKLGAAVGCALIAIPAYGVGARLGGSRAAGAVAAVLASTTATSDFLALEFVKQGIGLTIALGALWAIMYTLDQPSARRIAGSFAMLGLALLAHKLAAGIVILVAAPAIAIRTRQMFRGRRLLYAILAASAVVITAIVVGIVAPQRFISPHDLGMFADMFTTHARALAPALAFPNGALVFDYEPLIGGVVALAAAIILYKRRPANRTIAWPIAIIGVLIALPFLDVTDPQGLAFRLRVTAFVPLALNSAIVLGEALRYSKYVAIAVPLVLAFELPRDRTEGEVLTHPALAAAVMAAADQLPYGKTIIVPERHILFMVDWYTRADVSLRPEPIPYARRARLFGLAFIGGAHTPLDAALDAARTRPDPPIGLHPRYRNGLVLVTEPTWDWLLAQLPAADRAHFTAWPTI